MRRAGHERVPWSVIRNKLEMEGDTLPPPLPAERFWGNFHARRSRMPSLAPVSAARPGVPTIWTTLAAACVVLALSAGLWFGLPVWRSKGRGAIRSFEIGVPHRAVLILDAPDAQASILWVVGIDNLFDEEVGT